MVGFEEKLGWLDGYWIFCFFIFILDVVCERVFIVDLLRNYYLLVWIWVFIEILDLILIFVVIVLYRFSFVFLVEMVIIREYLVFLLVILSCGCLYYYLVIGKIVIVFESVSWVVVFC